MLKIKYLFHENKNVQKPLIVIFVGVRDGGVGRPEGVLPLAKGEFVVGVILGKGLFGVNIPKTPIGIALGKMDMKAGGIFETKLTLK